MKLSGARTMRAVPQEIWGFLMTPGRLRACLPGCERFEASAPDRFDVTMRLGVAFLKGTYTGTVHVAGQQPHERLELDVHGGGALGALAGSGTIHLVEAGPQTYVLYDGEAAVTGRVAALGERVIEATARRLIGSFLDCVASHVEA